MAEMAGFKPDYAYFLALYASAPDNTFEMADVCGRKLPESYQTPPDMFKDFSSAFVKK